MYCCRPIGPIHMEYIMLSSHNFEEEEKWRWRGRCLIYRSFTSNRVLDQLTFSRIISLHSRACVIVNRYIRPSLLCRPVHVHLALPDNGLQCYSQGSPWLNRWRGTWLNLADFVTIYRPSFQLVGCYCLFIFCWISTQLLKRSETWFCYWKYFTGIPNK